MMTLLSCLGQDALTAGRPCALVQPLQPQPLQLQPLQPQPLRLMASEFPMVISYQNLCRNLHMPDLAYPNLTHRILNHLP